MSDIRGLSIKQPWAYAIIHLGKDIENRTWRMNYRGWLAIHASKTVDDCLGTLPDGSKVSLDMTNTRGAIIGIVRVIDCVTEHSSVWFEGPFGLVLEYPTPIKPIEYRGSLGFWDVDHFVAEELKEAVKVRHGIVI